MISAVFLVVIHLNAEIITRSVTQVLGTVILIFSGAPQTHTHTVWRNLLIWFSDFDGGISLTLITTFSNVDWWSGTLSGNLKLNVFLCLNFQNHFWQSGHCQSAGSGPLLICIKWGEHPWYHRNLVFYNRITLVVTPRGAFPFSLFLYASDWFWLIHFLTFFFVVSQTWPLSLWWTGTSSEWNTSVVRKRWLAGAL